MELNIVCNILYIIFICYLFNKILCQQNRLQEYEHNYSRLLTNFENQFAELHQRNELFELYQNHYKRILMSQWSDERIQAIKSLESLHILEIILKDTGYILTNDDKEAIAIHSVRLNNIDIFKYLFEHHNYKPIIENISCYDINDSYNSQLIYAILKYTDNVNKNEFIEYLVEVYKLNIHKQLHTRYNILYKAIYYDNIGVVKYLIEKQKMVYKNIENFDYPKPGSRCYEYINDMIQ